MPIADYRRLCQQTADMRALTAGAAGGRTANAVHKKRRWHRDGIVFVMRSRDL